MEMGTRGKRRRQHTFWVAASDLPTTAVHPVYQRLNALLDEHDFDAFVECLCQPFYAATMGRSSVAPGIYFRLLLVGYFEAIDAERGMALGVGDSLAIRRSLRDRVG
jgi:transposase